MAIDESTIGLFVVELAEREIVAAAGGADKEVGDSNGAEHKTIVRLIIGDLAVRALVQE